MLEREKANIDMPTIGYLATVDQTPANGGWMMTTGSKYGVRGTDNRMNITLIRSILMMLTVPLYPDAKTIAWSYPITWGLTAAEMVLYYRFADWRSTKLIKEERQIG